MDAQHMLPETQITRKGAGVCSKGRNKHSIDVTGQTVRKLRGPKGETPLVKSIKEIVYLFLV